MPPDCDARVDLGAWTPGPVFEFFASESGLEPAELYQTLNMGVGMIAVTPAGETESVLEELSQGGESPFVCGEIVSGTGRVVLESR